jgi:hypothetical protein
MIQPETKLDRFHAFMHAYSSDDLIIKPPVNSNKLEQGPFDTNCTKNDGNLKFDSDSQIY